MWDDSDLNIYSAISRPEQYSSLAFQAFAAARTPRECIELYRQALRRFVRQSVCALVSQIADVTLETTLISLATALRIPQQVVDMARWAGMLPEISIQNQCSNIR